MLMLISNKLKKWTIRKKYRIKGRKRSKKKWNKKWIQCRRRWVIKLNNNKSWCRRNKHPFTSLNNLNNNSSLKVKQFLNNKHLKIKFQFQIKNNSNNKRFQILISSKTQNLQLLHQDSSSSTKSNKPQKLQLHKLVPCQPVEAQLKQELTTVVV